mmetsp:Transcript_113420/g.284071  ORF Transcript_113420/g.284071 Transcript_113420/m.284071 type:complete len:106 (-) Transcript_113420:38-355(-)
MMNWCLSLEGVVEVQAVMKEDQVAVRAVDRERASLAVRATRTPMSIPQVDQAALSCLQVLVVKATTDCPMASAAAHMVSEDPLGRVAEEAVRVGDLVAMEPTLGK